MELPRNNGEPIETKITPERRLFKGITTGVATKIGRALVLSTAIGLSSGAVLADEKQNSGTTLAAGGKTCYDNTMQKTSNNHNLTKTNMGLQNAPEGHFDEQNQQVEQQNESNEREQEIPYSKYKEVETKSDKLHSDIQVLMDGSREMTIGEYTFKYGDNGLEISKKGTENVINLYQDYHQIGLMLNGSTEAYAGRRKKEEGPINFGNEEKPEDYTYHAKAINLLIGRSGKITHFQSVVDKEKAKRKAEEDKKREDKKKEIEDFSTDTGLE